MSEDPEWQRIHLSNKVLNHHTTHPGRIDDFVCKIIVVLDLSLHSQQEKAIMFTKQRPTKSVTAMICPNQMTAIMHSQNVATIRAPHDTTSRAHSCQFNVTS